MAQINRRQALKLFGAAGAACLGGAACDSEDGSTEPAGATNSAAPVRIGLLLPRQGGLKQLGDEMLNGFQQYLDLHDNRLGGHPVTLLTEDEGSTAGAAQAAVRKLAGQGALALSGVASSEAMLAIRDTVEQAQIPLIGSNASPTSLQGVIYIWRTSYVNDEPGRALGAYLAAQVHGPIGLVAPDSTAGKDEISGFREAFGERDERISEPVVWTGGNPSPGDGFFTEALATLAAAQPKAVFCYFAGAAAVAFVRQYRAAGLTAQIYAPGFLTDGGVLSSLGSAARGIYTAANYSPDLDNAANREFSGAYRRTYESTPSTYAVASYDAAAVLDKAIGLAGDTLTPQRVNLMLGKVGQIDSPRGVWQFNQPRTPQQKWYLRQVKADGPVLANVLLKELGTLG